MPGDLSEHFSLHEWRQPAAYGLPEMPYPAERVRQYLLPLVVHICEPIRSRLGRPVRVIRGGGYRSPEWQKRHGGGPASRHVVGDAADLACEGFTGEELHALVLEMWEGGNLLRLGGLGLYPGREFVHVDTRPHRYRQLARWTGSGR